MSMNSFHARTARPKSKALARSQAATARAPQGVRVDALLVQQGFAASRAAALRLIAAGRVSQKVGAEKGSGQGRSRGGCA